MNGSVNDFFMFFLRVFRVNTFITTFFVCANATIMNDHGCVFVRQFVCFSVYNCSLSNYLLLVLCVQ